MQQFLDRFTPLPGIVGGFHVLAIAGSELLTVLALVPDGAYTAWVQADADIQFRFDGSMAPGPGFVLPAFTILPINNLQMLNHLVLIGTATVLVQFGQGPVGPIPPAP